MNRPFQMPLYFEFSGSLICLKNYWSLAISIVVDENLEDLQTAWVPYKAVFHCEQFGKDSF